MSKRLKTKEEVQKSLERVISSEERIRRAEEIYQRRKMQGGVRVSTNNVNTKTKPEYRMFKKLILQIAICLLIYFIFYLIKNSNYIFSEEVIKKTREFLSYDINFQNLYTQAGDYYNNNLKAFFETERKNEEENQIDNTNEQIVEEIINEVNANEQAEGEKVNEINTNEQVEGGIGGGEEGVALISNETVEVSSDEEPKEEIPLTQMEIDANEIKANYNLILPLKGTITSRFGPRQPTEIVSANHAGIDIAVNEGTVFIASMEGKVTLVSSQGGYGNHVYIENGDVTTLYAHCKTIYVKEGDSISQGQQIGEVGETRKRNRATSSF